MPLKPDRKIEFTTHEGTWLSLDVSPDGKTIVIELLGDIYTLPIAGGQAKLISSGLPFDSQPRFSPEGKWIAFISDHEGSENIWIMYPDGTEPKQVSKDPSSDFASPSWAPNGKYIFVSKAGFGITTYELWMYHVDGGSGVQITKAKKNFLVITSHCKSCVTSCWALLFALRPLCCARCDTTQRCVADLLQNRSADRSREVRALG